MDVYRSTRTDLTQATGTVVASSLTAGGNIKVKAAGDIAVVGSAVVAKGQSSARPRV